MGSNKQIDFFTNAIKKLLNQFENFKELFKFWFMSATTFS